MNSQQFIRFSLYLRRLYIAARIMTLTQSISRLCFTTDKALINGVKEALENKTLWQINQVRLWPGEFKDTQEIKKEMINFLAKLQSKTTQ